MIPGAWDFVTAAYGIVYVGIVLYILSLFSKARELAAHELNGP